MANTEYTGNAPDSYNKEATGTNGMGMDRQMTHEEHQTAKAAARFGYGPLAHVNTPGGGGGDRLPAFGGEFQPGLYKQVKDRKFANPAPLGLSAFALTTFVLGLIDMGTRGIAEPNLVVGLAFGYGGLVQLLAGMWYVHSSSYFHSAHSFHPAVPETRGFGADAFVTTREMAVGNTFGATALSSYGGFWLSFAIILTPGGFEIQSNLEEAGAQAFHNSFGLYLMVSPPQQKPPS